MRFDSVVGLISYTTSTNEMLETVYTPVTRSVFAQKDSIRQSEHYQANANGLKPELMFTVWSHDYFGENSLSYGGNTYLIERTYRKKNNKEIELICSGLVNGGT